MVLPVKAQDLIGNKLLAALPAEEYIRILPDLEQTSFSFGESIYEASERPNYAHFPTTSVVSLVYDMIDGASAEKCMVGNEGLIGISLFTGGETRPNRAIVRHAGGAVRMRASAFREEFRRGGSFQRLMLRHVHALLTQISQKAVCNGHHSIEQRLACWLLMTHDRVVSEKLQVTQELVSTLLGVSREGVSLTNGSLRNKGVIVSTRGYITILDRAGLETIACECYRIVKDEYDRLLDLRTSLSPSSVYAASRLSRSVPAI
jgi:CRP-like cAMP-binding protein